VRPEGFRAAVSSDRSQELGCDHGCCSPTLTGLSDWAQMRRRCMGPGVQAPYTSSRPRDCLPDTLFDPSAAITHEGHETACALGVLRRPSQATASAAGRLQVCRPRGSAIFVCGILPASSQSRGTVPIITHTTSLNPAYLHPTGSCQLLPNPKRRKHSIQGPK